MNGAGHDAWETLWGDPFNFGELLGWLLFVWAAVGFAYVLGLWPP